MPLTITHTLTKSFGKCVLLYSWDTNRHDKRKQIHTHVPKHSNEVQ